MTASSGSDKSKGRDKTPIQVPGKEALRPPLPKRFYKLATISAATTSPSPLVGEGRRGGDRRTSTDLDAPPPDLRHEGGGVGARFQILLDSRPVKTPKKLALAVPAEALAAAIAAEWNAQGSHIDPDTMPLTRLANTAIDAVAAAMPEVAADIVQYCGSDLLCYRAEAPVPLVRAQAEHWDPVLAWAKSSLGTTFKIAKGLMPVVQPKAALDKIAAALKPYDAFSLSALHVMTTLTGSGLLALAHAKGHLTLEDTWAAAHVDDDFQTKHWGTDSEAEARRQRRFAEFQAASRFFSLGAR